MSDPILQTYQVPKVLKTRLSDSLCDEDSYRGAVFKFPLEVSFDRHIFGFVHKGRDYWNGVNYIMSDGSKSQLEQKANYGDNAWTEVRIAPGAIVRKIVIYGNFEFGGV